MRTTFVVVVTSLAIVAAGCGAGEEEWCGPVEMRGGAAAELVLVADLPLEGRSARKARQIANAIRVELGTRGFRAGRHAVGFQVCDHASAETGRWEPSSCSRNANAYGDRDEVIGVVGPLDSGCAAVMIPVLDNARNGGIPIVSPSTTYSCLTEGGPGCDVTEPDRYYPTGSRNFLRVVGSDTHESAALAELAKRLGARRLVVLDDGEAYGRGIATGVRRAARALGLQVVAFQAWDPGAKSYAALFERLEAKRPDAVVLAGLLEQNGARVIADKVAVLGPNDGPVKLLASDGFAGPALLEAPGAAATDMLLTEVGLPLDRFPAAAERFARRLVAAYPGSRPVDPYALFGAQAAQVFLDAIACVRRDPRRRDLQALRDQGRGRADRVVLVRPKRRSLAGEGPCHRRVGEPRRRSARARDDDRADSRRRSPPLPADTGPGRSRTVATLDSRWRRASTG